MLDPAKIRCVFCDKSCEEVNPKIMIERNDLFVCGKCLLELAEEMATGINNLPTHPQNISLN